MKPFVKWAGGKRQLLPTLINNLPNMNNFTTYVEPFVGGGAMLFEIVKLYKFEKMIINDINSSLMKCYELIKQDPQKLINELKTLQNEFLSTQKQDEFFYQIRNEFNKTKEPKYFIFLNKTCFNGLFRLNKSGEFNTPFGKYKNPLICDEENILNVHKVLKNVIIKNSDYKNLINDIDDKTFIYFDPPYRPLSKTASFTSYFNNIFDDNEQIRLAEFVNKCNDLGAKFLLSNSDPKNTNKDDEFFDKLYKNYAILRINATRCINSKASNRGAITELLIKNYKG